MDRNMQERFRRCFVEWVSQQESDLDELLHALPASSDGRCKDESTDEAQLRSLVEKGLRHFEEYSEKRLSMAKEYAPTFFCPTWCSSFENSFLWMGGCRPTMAIRLVYALSASDLEARLDEVIGDTVEDQEGRWSGAVGLLILSAKQLNLINDLHCRTLKEEEKIGGKMATLQVYLDIF